jgi:hypothetical protein
LLDDGTNEYSTVTDSNGESLINDVIFGTYNVNLEGHTDYTPKSKTVNNASFRVDLTVLD